jgi:regulator of sirC expression with transglutaminase-like and TPR domain
VKKTIEQFAALVAPELQDDEIDLLRAALTYAKAEYPELDVEAYVEKVERLAGRVREELKATADTQGVLRTLNRVLFEEEGLHGNRDDYYDPRNSFLNDVLERKTGIPIALSVIYMEVARRVGLPVFGVGMPGHFLLKHYDIEGQQTFIDAFHGGRLLTPEETRLRMKEVYEGQLQSQPEFMNTVGNRQILTRMLNNLRSIYISSRNFKKALTIVDLILAIHPRSPQDVRQRALLRYNEGMLRAAADDLDEYVRIAPEASDAEEMRQTAVSIRRTLAMMN